MSEHIQLQLLHALIWLIDTHHPELTVKEAIEQGKQHQQNQKPASNKST
jgi:hypothetical protein